MPGHACCACFDIMTSAISTTQSRAATMSPHWSRPHWRVIYYHAVLPEQRARFAEHLAWCSERFTWCTLSAGVEGLKSGLLDRPQMSLTFDDADASVSELLPILEEFGIHACIYVVPTYVERGESFRDPRPRPIMTWTQLREWLAAGHEIGSHTYSHANSPLCTPERLRQELLWSKVALEDALGVPVTHFAYPWGQHSTCTLDLLKELGCYRSAATTHRGQMRSGHELLALRRDRAELNQPAEAIGRHMQRADRWYWLRHLRPSQLRSCWRRTTSPRWEALADPQSVT